MNERNDLVVTRLGPFGTAATECAHQMLFNAMYMLGELPKVTMSDELRSKTQNVCQALIGTKHDLITEVAELDDLATAGGTDAAAIGRRVERIFRWARDELMKLHELVTALEDEGQRDPSVRLAHLLVMESAGNVMKPFMAMREAAEAVLSALPPEDQAPPEESVS